MKIGFRIMDILDLGQDPSLNHFICTSGNFRVFLLTYFYFQSFAVRTSEIFLSQLFLLISASAVPSPLVEAGAAPGKLVALAHKSTVF